MICNAGLQSIIARKRLATTRHRTGRDIRGYYWENSALHHNYHRPPLRTQCWPLNAVLEMLLARKDLIVSNNISKKNILNRPIENVSNKNNWIFWNWQILERINLIVGFLQQQNPESEVLGRYSCMDPNIDIYKWSDLLERALGTSQLWPWLAKVLSFFINISILFLRCFSLIFLA